MQMVNAHGSAFSYTLPADPTNIDNAAKTVTLQWSDFVPVTSIPQADAPSAPHILFIYIAIGSPGMVHSGSNWMFMTTDPKAAGRRQYCGAVAWNGARDYSKDPTGTGFVRCQRIP